MAQFDAGIISQISDMAPNPLKAKQDAYTLYDQKNRAQLNALTLQQAKGQQSEQEAAKKILQGSNLSTDKGQNEALEKVSRVSPDLAMKFKQDFQKQKGADLENQMKHLQVVEEQLIPMISSVDKVIGDMEPMKKLYDQGKITKADLDAMTMRKMAPEIAALKANGDPAIGQEVAKWATPQNMTYDGLVSTENRTKQGREMAKQRRAELQTAISQQRADTYQENTLSLERSRLSQEKARDKKESDREAGIFDKDTLHDMAEQYAIHGDKSVFQNMGRQASAATNVVNLRKMIRQVNQENGLSPGDNAAAVARFNADMAEMRKVGNIQGGVVYAEGELNRMIPLALDSSDKLPRGKFVPFNKLMQQGEKAVSDVRMKDFYVKTQSILNAYDVLAARGGSDVAKREQNRQMLLTADSPKAYKVALDAIRQEMQAAEKGGEEAKSSVARDIGSKHKPISSGADSAPTNTSKTNSQVVDWSSLK